MDRFGISVVLRMIWLWVPCLFASGCLVEFPAPQQEQEMQQLCDAGMNPCDPSTQVCRIEQQKILCDCRDGLQWSADGSRCVPTSSAHPASDGLGTSSSGGSPQQSPGVCRPSPEVCDDLDNDCDGKIDEDLTPPLAARQLGVCAGQGKVCRGADGWGEPSYEAIPGYEATETSVDGKDNDCDGAVDEAAMPYNGTRAVIPGTVQAENFDLGGEGVGYHDFESANLGGGYRTAEGVDIGGSYTLGWSRPGEWLKYSVTVTTTKEYTITFRLAMSGSGSAFHLEVDGVNVTGTLSIPNTGDWGAYTDVTRTGVALTAGNHTLRMVWETGSPAGENANFDYILFQ